MAMPENRSAYWAEPETGQAYPLSFEAYRRAREAEERPLARHLTLGAALDRQVWDRWRLAPTPEVEVLLTIRADAPPRVRRIASEVLRAIRRGRPAGDAIRQVSSRFGLRQARARACLADCLGFQMRPVRDDGAAPARARQPVAYPVDLM